MNRFSKKIASDIVLFGLFWICIFGEWHTVRAFGDDASIYLVDFDETAFDLYLKGYYPVEYTYADFRRDSIESMTSHYVATDSNNFSAIVDTIEQDVLQNGWSVIDNFFVNAWINLKTGVITVAQGFTDDFKHELDGRFKTTPSSDTVSIGSGQWVKGRCVVYLRSNYAYDVYTVDYGVSSIDDVYFTMCSNGGVIACAVSSGPVRLRFYYNYVSGGTNTEYIDMGYSYSGSLYSGYYLGSPAWNTAYISGLSAQYTDKASACADFYGNSPISDIEPVWNGDGYYSDTSANYNINLPALPVIDWPSISTNNKTKYGVDFPDIDLTVDFQLPDSYYPQQVVYDVPYYLINDDSQPWEVSTIDWSSPSLPSSDLVDGDASFFQDSFSVLPLGLVSLIVGVLICLLLFTIL